MSIMYEESWLFRPNDQWYGDIHVIVCSNDLIFCTSVHLGMANNVAEGSFHFLCTKKSFSIFGVPKIVFFCEERTKYLLQNGTTPFFKNIRPYFMSNYQMVACQQLSINLLSNRQISANSVGSGSNLNYNCFIDCSLFFLKIIFRYTCEYFIKDPPIVLQDSPSS